MQIKMKFIRLKAEGIPIYKIAHMLGVHRTTLTLWHKELADLILIAKQDYLDELLYENENTKLHRIESLSRQLSRLYELLDNSGAVEISNSYHSEVLDLISKYTKLLQLEMNEKHIERLIKNNRKETEQGNAEKKAKNIWVTDMENFRMHQPEEVMEEEGSANESENIQENIIEVDEEDKTLDTYDGLEVCRDFSDEEPEIQEIFNRTIKRSRRIEEGEESVKNSSLDENSAEEEIEESRNLKSINPASR
jgi:vacuolar-type H+-ATPase subunit I/STV1